MILTDEQSKASTVCAVELLKLGTYRIRQVPNYQIFHIIKHTYAELSYIHTHTHTYIQIILLFPSQNSIIVNMLINKLHKEINKYNRKKRK